MALTNNQIVVGCGLASFAGTAAVGFAAYKVSSLWVKTPAAGLTVLMMSVSYAVFKNYQKKTPVYEFKDKIIKSVTDEDLVFNVSATIIAMVVTFLCLGTSAPDARLASLENRIPLLQKLVSSGIADHLKNWGMCNIKEIKGSYIKEYTQFLLKKIEFIKTFE